MSKMKKTMLIVDNIPLTPHLQGGPVRIFKNFNYLSDKYQIYYLGCYGTGSKHKNRIREENIQVTKNKYIQYLLDNMILKQNNKLLYGGSFYDTITRFIMLKHKIYNNRIKELVKKCKILVASHPWTFTSLKKYATKNHLLIYDAHNCEYQLVKDKYKGILGKLVIHWTKKIEKEACEKSDIILACSENEKRNFMKYFKVDKEKIHIIPNSVETQKFTMTTQAEKNMYKKKYGFENQKCALFIGTNYFPNNEAADFIIDELAKKLTDIQFIIIGSIITHFKRKGKWLPRNVHLTGQIEEQKLIEMSKMCDIALNPVMLGSGTNIKVIDYLAWGIPCITTAKGVRGMKVTNKKELLIGPRNSFADMIGEILYDKQIKKVLTKKGREFVEKNYDSKIIAKQIETICNNYLMNKFLDV